MMHSGMMMAYGAITAVAAGLVLLPATCAAQATQHAPDSSGVQALLEERVSAGVAGLVAVTLDAAGHAYHAAGVKQAGGDVVDSLTVFEIGSVSKALTGLLLADMVVRGEVALDDAVQQYLPHGVRMPGGATRAITLLDLATHRSGLPRLPDNMTPLDATNPYAAYDTSRLHAFLDSHQLRREPGEAYEYSNLGAGLLGHVLALRAGRGLEDLVMERILQPLGMHDTRLEPTPSMRQRLAVGHTAGGQPTANWQFNSLAGAGGWFSTPADMRRLAAAMLQPPAGSLGDAFDLAMRAHADTGQPQLRIGLGWHVLQRGEHPVAWHNGQTGGYFAFIGAKAEAGSAVVVLSATSRPLDDLALTILQLPGTRSP